MVTVYSRARIGRIDVDFTRETAEGLIQDGKDNLGVLPDNEARDLLEGIADFLIEREY
nr:hypothetical protein [Halorhabdus rudnickae]